ncbi:hypothetical protein B0T10DRAFT_502636 [Thelonectria olida]|uniref:Uncharacterized protein n=1 Tax=Thelonectria olida TaxID=1576542 RepID=A0A9P9AG68_9HYPO|nr:hypothetical protein B0T10DRAFT_502636 [Thelonectria olida]
MALLVWFVTGASSGFGLLLCQRALLSGHRVIGSVRSRTRAVEATDSIEAKGGHIIEMDMTESQERIASKVKAAEAVYGRIDVLVNNAGCSIVGPLEAFTEAEASHLFQTNFFGALYTIQATLPGMRERRAGTIVNISSVEGQDGTAASGLYASSKFALEGMSESLGHEVKEFGISVLVVEPGAFRTNFLNAVAMNEKGVPEGYKGTVVDRVAQALRALAEKAAKLPRTAGDPAKAVERMFEVISGEGIGGPLKGKIFRLPLGEDSLRRIGDKVASVSGDISLAGAIGSSTKY